MKDSLKMYTIIMVNDVLLLKCTQLFMINNEVQNKLRQYLYTLL